MKNKYQRMSKEEKAKVKEKYYATEKGKEMKTRLDRLMVIGTIGICFSIFLIISGYLSHKIEWYTWVVAIILLLFSIVYIIGSIQIRGKVLNQFAVKNVK